MNAVDCIQAFNQGREAERLAIKYRLMRQDAFAFLRGTCHLFYQQWQHELAQIKSPPAWICGDLHLENFGCYKGDNRLVYFDLNDFDEAVLAPASWELARFLTSILVAADSLRLAAQDAQGLCALFLDRYASTLVEGKAKWVERNTAEGMIKDLLDPLKLRSRKAFLDSRTELHKSKRCIRVDGKRALTMEDDKHEELLVFLQQFAAQQAEPQFFQPLDIARRIAGTGSLGIARYVVLVQGRGSPDHNYLLDLKQACPSALSPYLTHPQPAWRSEAERVMQVQQRVQAIPVAFLKPTVFDHKPFLLKGLQPTEDRLRLELWQGKLKRLESVIGTMGDIVAWGHLRSSGRQGSAITDAWIDFGNDHASWRKPMIGLVNAAWHRTTDDWQAYCQAYDDGTFRSIT